VHRVKIHQGDINKLAVDAIVSAETSPVEPVYAARAVGADFLDSCLEIGKCPVGEVVVSLADNLSAELVIHTVGPIWRGGDYREEQQLASCYQNAMQAAKAENLKSIAFPTISCGTAGFPARRAVKIAVREVNHALRQNPLLESVVFCCFDPVTTALYRNHIGK
jgi:O-acetyl-ADP-ribose deacetylase (regulator of RNase III)